MKSNYVELINLTIRRDLLGATTIDFIETPKSIKTLLQSGGGFKLFEPEPLFDAYTILVDNLENVYSKYLVYSPNDHSSPMEVYKSLDRRFEDFKEDLFKGLNQDDGTEDVLSYHIYIKLNELFTDLSKKLLDQASVHKFDIDYIKENFLHIL